MNPTYAAAAGGGDQYTNTGKELIHIKNGGGGAVVLTLDIEKTVDGQSVVDPIVTIPAGEERMLGPFTSVYEDPDKNVSLTYDGVASLTIGVFKLP